MKKITPNRSSRHLVEAELRSAIGGQYNVQAERMACDTAATAMPPDDTYHDPDMWDMIEGAINKLHDLAGSGSGA